MTANEPRLTLDFRLLGPLRVLAGNDPLALGGQQRRALLALLLANRNRVVPSGAIVDALWGDDPPVTATASIQVGVSGVRAALGQVGAHRGPLRIVPGGYQLDVEFGRCDADRFTASVEQGRRARAAGDLDTAATHVRDARAQWSGSALQDLAGYDFAAHIAVGLGEERRSVQEACFEVELDRGRHLAVVAELAVLVRENPPREHLWALYLVALYRSGRQAEALAAYRELHEALLDQLGVEPTPELTRLQQALLTHDSQLALNPVDPTLTARDQPVDFAGVLVLPDGQSVLIDGIVRMGRSSANHIVVPDPRASRHHAAVAPSARGYVLTDLNSTNGTNVNGELALVATPLMDGDLISIGAFQVTFRVRSRSR